MISHEEFKAEIPEFQAQIKTNKAKRKSQEVGIKVQKEKRIKNMDIEWTKEVLEYSNEET